VLICVNTEIHACNHSGDPRAGGTSKSPHGGQQNGGVCVCKCTPVQTEAGESWQLLSYVHSEVYGCITIQRMLVADLEWSAPQDGA